MIIVEYLGPGDIFKLIDMTRRLKPLQRPESTEVDFAPFVAVT